MVHAGILVSFPSWFPNPVLWANKQKQQQQPGSKISFSTQRSSLLIVSVLLKGNFTPTFAVSDIHHFRSASQLPFQETHDGLSRHQETITEPVCSYFTLQAQIAEIYNTPHKRAETTQLRFSTRPVLQPKGTSWKHWSVFACLRTGDRHMESESFNG